MAVLDTVRNVAVQVVQRAINAGWRIRGRKRECGGQKALQQQSVDRDQTDRDTPYNRALLKTVHALNCSI